MPVIIEYQKVRQEYPEFFQVWNDTLQEAIGQVQSAWGLNFGGFFPGAKEFGITNVRPRYLALGTNSGIEEWRFNLGTGWKTAFANNIIEDVYVGIVGAILPNAQNKITALKFTGGGEELPVIPLEGNVEVLDEPTIAFPKGLVIPEEQPLTLEVQSKLAGDRVIVPFGFALTKKRVLINKTPT